MTTPREREPEPTAARITRPEQYLAALRRVTEALRARKAPKRDESTKPKEGTAR